MEAAVSLQHNLLEALLHTRHLIMAKGSLQKSGQKLKKAEGQVTERTLPKTVLAN